MCDRVGCVGGVRHVWIGIQSWLLRRYDWALQTYITGSNTSPYLRRYDRIARDLKCM